MGKTTAIRANKMEEKTRTNWKIHIKAAKARAIRLKDYFNHEIHESHE
jgi:hypothetical protein